MGEAARRQKWADGPGITLPNHGVPRRVVPRVTAVTLLLPSHVEQETAQTYRQLVAQRSAKGNTTVELDEFRVELLMAKLMSEGVGLHFSRRSWP